MSINPQDPQSRIESWLAVIADGSDVELERPQSRVEEWLAHIYAKSGGVANRVSSLDGHDLIGGASVVEAVGTPAYVSDDDIAQYADYGITDSGWYIFTRISALNGVSATADFNITGAAGCKSVAVGDTHVDVAVKFTVAAESQKVTVEWGEYTEIFVFRATDLAVRNLDYRATFYLYDLTPYCTWTYSLASGTFAANTHYFTRSGDVYTEAEVVVGQSIPANTYYIHSALSIEGFVRNVSYSLPYVDCPVTVHLPAIADDNYGAWFEIQTEFLADKSVTLTVPTGAHVSKAWTQTPKKGVNVLNMQYHSKSATWRLVVTTWDNAAT